MYQRLITVAVFFSFVTLFSPVANRAEEEAGIPIAEVKRDTAVDFEKELLPVLRRKCLACHNSTDAESDLVLETPQTIRKGGASGEAVVAGNSQESLLLIVASHADEPIMPPADNDVGAEPLTSEELGLLKLWIDQGAEGEVTGSGTLSWQPLPAGVNPIYSVAVSPDGQYAAAGRANQIFLYHIPSRRELGRLTDPSLLELGLYDKAGVAHLDLVQSMTFSSDNRTLASGGYRTVKLWQREPNLRKLAIVDLTADPTALAVSPDGLRVAIGMDNGRIIVLAGAVVHRLVGHKAAVTDLEFTAEGAQLLSASRDQTVRLWDSGDGSAQGVLETPAEVLALTLLGDPARVVAGGSDQMIRVWQRDQVFGDAKSVAPLKELQGHGGPVTALEQVPGQPQQVVSGSHDGTLRVWDAAEGKQLLSMNHEGPIESIAVRAHEQVRFASASSNNSARLWAADGKQIAELKGDFRKKIDIQVVERRLAVAQRQIENANADLKQVNDRKAAEEKNATAAEEARKKAEGELQAKAEAATKALAEKEAAEKKLADAKGGVQKAEEQKKAAVEQIAKADLMIKDAQTAVEAARQAMAEAEKQLAQAQLARKEREVAQKKADTELQTAGTAAQQAEEAMKTAATEAEKAVNEKEAANKSLESAARTAQRAQKAVERIAEQVPQVEAAVKSFESAKTETEQRLETVKAEATQSEQPLLSVAFSPDARTLSTGGADHRVRLYDAETGAALENLGEHQGHVKALAYSPGGDVVSVGADKALYVWKAYPEWKLVRTIGSTDDPQQLVDRVTALDFSPDGKLLATGSGEPSRSGQLRIWNVESGELVKEIQDAHSDTIFGLQFSPDGTQLASCGADRFAKIFDVETGAFVRAFEGHTHHVLGVDWRADGRLLATSGADNVVKVWNVNTGDQARTISGFGKEVTGVQFLATGDEVVASSGDQNVRIKNTANGSNVRNFGGAEDFLYGVSASADGQILAAGGEDSVLRIWTGDGKPWVTFAPPSD